MQVHVATADLVTVPVDAIVNPGNSMGIMGGGTSGHIRRIGGDAVGMSTIPAVQVAARLGLRCLALSVVTNVASPDIAVHTTPEAVVAAATRSATRLAHLVRAAIAAERLLGVDR